MFDATLTGLDFSRASANYASHASLQAKIGKELVARALPYMAKDALLLDVGAGPGDVTRSWGRRALALDAAFGMCREAGKKGLSAIQARAEHLPLADEAVDAVVSNLMLQWLPAPRSFFAEAERVLKPSGVLAISNFAHGTLHELAKAFDSCGERHRMSEFVPEAILKDQVQAAGLEIITTHVETITEHYADMLDLFVYLRDIGAVNKRIDRPRGMLTMRKLREVSGHYPRTSQGIPASWVAQIVIARKP